MEAILTNFKKPNTRHFYAYKNRGKFIYGLNVDYANIENTIIVPTDDIDKDLQAIDRGLVKPKELIYLNVRAIPMLNIRITISLSLIFTFFYMLSKNKTLTIDGALFVYLLFCGFGVFIASWIVQKSYYFLGQTRARLSTTIYQITSILTISPILVYGLNPGQKGSLFDSLIYLIGATLIVPSLTTILSSINIKNHPGIKEIKYEWRINGRVYGAHPSENENDKPVLYPKGGRGFYPLNPIEYRTLIAYQQVRGDRQKAKQLMTSWHTKPLVIEKVRRLWSLQQFNLPRRLGIFLFRLSASLLCIFLEAIAKQTKFKYLHISVNWLKTQGLYRVFWIYQECEAGLKRLIAMQEI